MARVPGTPIAAKSATSLESTYRTPADLVGRIRNGPLGGVIGLDPCTAPDNPCDAEQFYTAEDDGLVQPWDTAGTIYVNPPFIIGAKFAARAIETAALPHAPRIVFLAPAAIGTRWIHDLWEHADDALFLRKRIRFEGVCATKIYVDGEKRPCLLGPDDLVHDLERPESHRYTEGSPTRGTVLFAFNCTLRTLEDLGTRALPLNRHVRKAS